MTHCKNNKASEVNVLEEYAAYRIFNLISNHSYRVRLLNIRYIDTAKKSSSQVHKGFLIEPPEHLAKRIEGQRLSVDGVSLAFLNSNELTDIYVFQYLIENTDWSLVMQKGEHACCHNGSIFRILSNNSILERSNIEQLKSRHVYIPYDFDLAGLVNAKYAYPHPSLKMRSVTQQRYRGFCTSAADLQLSIAKFNTLEAEIMAVPESIPGLTAKKIVTMKRYIGRFLDAASDSQSLIKSFQNRCL
ncbi:MAG: hypothetical protein VB957_12855 [Pseudomonadales bacterium]